MHKHTKSKPVVVVRNKLGLLPKLPDPVLVDSEVVATKTMVIAPNIVAQPLEEKKENVQPVDTTVQTDNKRPVLDSVKKLSEVNKEAETELKPALETSETMTPLAEVEQVIDEANDSTIVQTIPLVEQLKPIEPEWCENNQNWNCLAEAVVGLSHRNGKVVLPCQDAVACQQTPRSVLVMSDGAGSAAVSELGSQALAQGMLRLCHTLEPYLAALLDVTSNDSDDIDEQGRQMVRLLLRQAKGLLQDLAVVHRREVKDFRATLLMAVIGTERMLWLKVGDGAVVVERIEKMTDDSGQVNFIPRLSSLGDVGKGEFANQTTFVDGALSMAGVQWGILDSAEMTGVSVMSDGAAEKLVSNDGQQVAGQMSQWFDQLRQKKLRRGDLTLAFYTDRFNQNSTGDDRSIALAAAQIR